MQRKEFLYASKRTFTTSDANTASLDLEAKTTLVLPESRSHPGLHPGGRLLASSVKRVVRRHCSSLAAHTRKGKDGVLAGQAARHRAT